MGSEMTPLLVFEGGGPPRPPPVGQRESDMPGGGGLKGLDIPVW